MPQIDLEPKEYKAQPIKGEPMFQPGAGKRVAAWVAVFCFMLGLSFIVRFLFGDVAAGFGRWFAALFS